MEATFKDKVAIVTGGSYGIGRATAIAFAKNGAKVVIVDWLEDVETLNTIKTLGGEAVFVNCDVSKPEDVKTMVEKTIAIFGRLDYGFNNAGIEGSSSPVTECTDDNWDRTIDINLKGVWLCMKYQIPEMIKVGGGAIVNNASIAGLIGFARIPAYVASKHGVIGLTKNAALDFAQQNIRINAVCPGGIHTPMIDRFTGGDIRAMEQLKSGYPMARLGQPKEIAETVMFLCSNAASFITGQAIAIDGGYTSL